MKPHKHAALIKAWADGHIIQLARHDGWIDEPEPTWNPVFNYRIKPAEKVVRWLWINKTNGCWLWSSYYMTKKEADELAKERGITEYKKLEWSREEFDE